MLLMDDIIDYVDRATIKLDVTFEPIDVLAQSGDMIIAVPPDYLADNTRKPSVTIVSNNNNKTLW